MDNLTDSCFVVRQLINNLTPFEINNASQQQNHLGYCPYKLGVLPDEGASIHAALSVHKPTTHNVITSYSRSLTMQTSQL